MANYMSQVAKMLDINLDEDFTCNNGYTYRLTSDGIICPEYCTNSDTYEYSGILQDLLTGDLQIKRKPWKPKKDDFYYYVNQEGSVIETRWWDCSMDVIFYKFGNCYRTHEEAEANRDKWVAFYASDEVLEV